MREKNIKKNKMSTLTMVCLFVCFLSNISYLPHFTTNGLTQMISYPVWALLFAILCLRGARYISRKDGQILILVITLCVAFFVLEILTNKVYFSSLLTRYVIFAIVITLAGDMAASKGSDEFNETVVLSGYIVSTIILNVVIYFSYLRGQDLSSSFYTYSSKNEVAFINVSAIVMLLYWDAVVTKLQNIIRTLLIVFFVFMVGMMRCRSMLIAFVVVVGIFLVQKNQSKKMKKIIIVGMMILLVALQNSDIYNTIVNGIFLAGRDFSNVDALSSGRTQQINWALTQFQNNFLIGTGDTKTVDCFFLSALMQYGLVIGIVVIALACCPFVWGVRYYKRVKTSLAVIMTMCSLVYLIGGFFEENAPFGPGVRCYISWFLFGYLRMLSTRNDGRKSE